MKTAFVCDWLTGMRGGEKCLEAVCRDYPEADIFTLVYYPQNFAGQFAHHRVTTSFIQRLPGGQRLFRCWLPLFPRAVESFDLAGYDRVISFSHCVAKSVITPDDVPHLCYCHTPMRYAWSMRRQYLNSLGFLKRKAAGFLLERLKHWDARTACRADLFIANSLNVQRRIRDCYGRASRVIYPPVETKKFSVCREHEGYYLVLSAFVPYKRLDIALGAFARGPHRLVVAGSGPEYNRLRATASPNISFVLNPDDQTVQQLYRNCKSLVFPGEEDFGIVPLEAQACGKPVIAFGQGGALETVNDLNGRRPPTGIFFRQPSCDGLREAVAEFESLADRIDPEDCRRNAERFDTEIYRAQMRDAIETLRVSSASKSECVHQ